MNLRHNVRADYHECVRLKGTDRWGNPFEMQGQSLDFSRKGFGLLVDRDVVAPGSVISLDLPKKLQSKAIVQWTRREREAGPVRIGLRLINPRASLRFRMVACFLLALAMFSQLSMARGKGVSRATLNSQCKVVGAKEMKTAIQNALGKYVYLPSSEREFLLVQQQRMSRDEYASWLKTFYRNDERRQAAALAMQTQTAQPAVVSAAGAGAEAGLGGTQ